MNEKVPIEWAARSDLARVPGPRMALAAVAGFLLIHVVDRAWTVLEDARAWMR